MSFLRAPHVFVCVSPIALAFHIRCIKTYHTFFLHNVLFRIFFKWFCPECNNPGVVFRDSREDSYEYEDSGEESDGEGGGVGGEHQAKKASTRSRNRFRHLFTNLTPEQEEFVKESLSRASNFKMTRRTNQPDYRGVTYKECCDALMSFSKGEFPSKLFEEKFEKYDSHLYGIKVEGESVRGTRVVRGADKKEGVVCGVDTRRGDTSVYTVRWTDGFESLYSTYQVLEQAAVGQDVVTPDEDRENFKNFLCATMVVLYVHVYLFAIQDTNQNKKAWPGSEIKDSSKINRERVLRSTAWNTIKDLKAVACVNEHELQLLSTDKGLKGELEKNGSLLKMMGLSTGPRGLLKSERLRFNSKHRRLVRHVLRGAQQAWKLGRFPTIESFITPVARGLVSELPVACNSLKEEEQEQTVIRGVESSELERYGLATRANLARASNGKKGEEHVYVWYRYVPLTQIMLLTRPENKGVIRPTSENSDSVAPTRKNAQMYEHVSKLSRTGVKDGAFMKEIYESYFSVANVKKQASKVTYHNDSRLGSGMKHIQGRANTNLSPEEILKQLDTMLDIMDTNGFEPIMGKIGDREIAMCREILGKRAEDYWLVENEKHLEATWIVGVVDRLIAEGVTRQMVSTFSFALAVADFVTSYVNRTQDYLRCMRKNFHEFKGVLRSLMPFNSKNFDRLVSTATGAELHHEKDEQIASCWAVFIVICPPLMRKLFEIRVSELENKLARLRMKPLGNQTLVKRENSIKFVCRDLKKARSFRLGDTTAPFNENGECFKATVDENGEETTCKGLRDLFAYVGQRCRGLSNWSPHVARSEHVTLFVKDCVSKGIDRTDHRFLNFASRGRFGWMTMQQAYEFQQAERAPGEEAHSSILRSARTLASADTSASVQHDTTQGMYERGVSKNYSLVFGYIIYSLLVVLL